jgi:hypothetical protein
VKLQRRRILQLAAGAAVFRGVFRDVLLKPPVEGSVAIWDGEPKRTSIERDGVHDEP